MTTVRIPAVNNSRRRSSRMNTYSWALLIEGPVAVVTRAVGASLRC